MRPQFLSSARHPYWHDIPVSDWNDWKWQLRHRIRIYDQISEIIATTESERQALQSQPLRLKADLTPFFASLLDISNPLCPLRRQVIPTVGELTPNIFEKADPLSEDRDTPIKGIIHRYPDRVALFVTSECASYCRFCTRSRLVGKAEGAMSKAAISQCFDYIRANTQIRDVLLSGGDPFLLDDEFLDSVLAELRSIDHVEIVRINTRVPIFLPQRISLQFLQVLQRHQPVFVNINCNHPSELSLEAVESLKALADCGIPLGSQTVLMAGINDCPHLIKDLFHKLLINRVRPYYLYQCDPVYGSEQFRTPVSKGIEIIEFLRGHTTGLAVPTFVIDTPGGGGKVPLSPNYEVSRSPDRIILRNFEGYITSYREPTNYSPHDPSSCVACMSTNGDLKRSVSSILSGRTDYIKPQNWRQI